MRRFPFFAPHEGLLRRANVRGVMHARLPEWRLPLRAWQREAFDAWNAERPTDALIVATPGAGKTRLAARIAHALLAESSVERTLIVVPREHLKAQVARALAGAWIQLDPGFRNADRTLAPDFDGAVVTYQQVAAAPRTFAALARVPTLVLLDEIHHAGEHASWGQALRQAFEGARHRVALSGTPFRSDGNALPFVRYEAGACVPLTSYDYARALGDGVCRVLTFPLHGGEAEWISRDGTAMQANFDDALDRRHASERLRTALTQSAWLGDVLVKANAKLVELRMRGHQNAGGLVAAMNQDHARFVADLLERRCGVRAELVLSDLEGSGRRIARFAESSAPWIVAVHMVSEGVDIPRLRVGVFASNVVSELYFRQFCGRFVRTGADAEAVRDAAVYLPDDARLRSLAITIASDVRRGLHAKRDRDAGARAHGSREAQPPGLGEFASIAATATESHTLDFGPLFNPAAGAQTVPALAPPPKPAPQGEPISTVADRRETLRRDLRGLVARASEQFGVNHKLVHATLNERFGGSVATATLADLERRRIQVTRWLERRSYDGRR